MSSISLSQSCTYNVKKIYLYYCHWYSCHRKRFFYILVAEMSFHKGVPWVNAVECILARTKLSYQSLVQDGEAILTRIRGKQIDLFLSIDVSFSYMKEYIPIS